LGCATEPTGDSLEVESVNPSSCHEGDTPEITIDGYGMHPSVFRNASCSGDSVQVDDEFDALFGDIVLSPVKWQDSNTLTARIPDTLEVGLHDLTVVGPRGDTIVLKDAFEVLEGGSDTDTDTDTDIDTDTDTDSDTDTDTDGDDDGTSCENAIIINLNDFDYTENLTWDYFGNSFDPTNNCGDPGNSGRDIWFDVHHTPNKALMITETSDVDVLIRHVTSCEDFDCIDYSDEPEQFCIDGDLISAIRYIVVTEMDAQPGSISTIIMENLDGDCIDYTAN
jgi:hypothetical protein